MRIELPRECQRLGATRIHGVQKIYELDSGLASEGRAFEPLFVVRQLPYEVLHEIERRMAIVVPLRGERLRVVEGVLYAIPSACTTIVVSNSEREPTDRFAMEQSALETFGTYAKKPLILIHQKEAAFAAGVAAAGLGELLDEQGLVRDGKAEGMILGCLAALLAGKDYVGFIDADNYIPGAAFEYVKVFAAGFALAQTPYSMVRTLWHSKPKIVDSSLFFARYGRASLATNHYLNRMVGYATGFETEIVRTGNAGEHAVSTELAKRLRFAAGYAVEPFHFVDLFERLAEHQLPGDVDLIRRGVEIFQVETRNPHLHAARGDAHVRRMIASSLGAIYHSKAAPERLRREIAADLRRRKILARGEEPPAPRLYPPLGRADLSALERALAADARGDALLAKIAPQVAVAG